MIVWYEWQLKLNSRFMTVLFFLDDTEHGGETAFPVVGVDPYENDLADDSGVSEKNCGCILFLYVY